MDDHSEAFRRAEVARINALKAVRAALEAEHGQVWDTAQLRVEFDVKAFLAPYVSVRRLSDNAVGLLEFQHEPRFYYRFRPK